MEGIILVFCAIGSSIPVGFLASYVAETYGVTLALIVLGVCCIGVVYLTLKGIAKC